MSAIDRPHRFWRAGRSSESRPWCSVSCVCESCLDADAAYIGPGSPPVPSTALTRLQESLNPPRTKETQLALDLDRLKAAADEFSRFSEEHRDAYAEAARQTTTQLQHALPAMCESDQAAVSYYIAQLLGTIRNLPLKDAGDIVTDTAMGYSVGAALLLGMLDV